MPLSVGDKLGPYAILAPIGAGGMGELWKARDTRLNRMVAIKRLRGEHTARFEQEARASAAPSAAPKSGYRNFNSGFPGSLRTK